MGRGRAKAKQTKVARELKYRAIDTDFSSLARELRGGEEGPGVPPAYADLVERESEDEDDYSGPPDEEYEDLRKSG
jgi:hypothetical protein